VASLLLILIWYQSYLEREAGHPTERRANAIKNFAREICVDRRAKKIGALSIEERRVKKRGILSPKAREATPVAVELMAKSWIAVSGV
jgi:hypothetical protein